MGPSFSIPKSPGEYSAAVDFFSKLKPTRFYAIVIPGMDQIGIELAVVTKCASYRACSAGCSAGFAVHHQSALWQGK